MEQSTKARGDIAEYRVVAELLERGHAVLMPCGDRLPYDVAIDVEGKLRRLQVRRAWSTNGSTFYIDTRRSQTNRKIYKFTKHSPSAYDFLIAWIPDSSIFYVLPSKAACSYGSLITLNDLHDARQRDAEHLRQRSAAHHVVEEPDHRVAPRILLRSR